MGNNVHFKRLLLSIFAIVSIFILLRAFVSYTPTGSPIRIGFGELMTHIERGNIKSIEITDTGNIRGEFNYPVKDSSRFTSQILTPSNQEVEDWRSKMAEKNPEIRVEIIKSSAGFMALLFAWAPMILIFGFLIFFMRNMQSGNSKAMSFGKSKAKLASASLKKKTFKDVAGQDEPKEELQEIVDFLKEPAKFQKLGGHIPKGVLLMGPPGTGKTLLARAVAGEANVPFFSISGSDFVEMFVGVGASRVRDLFEQGKKNAPCIVFIDEIDAVGRHRGAGLGGGNDEREQTLNQLLSEMDGFESNDGVIIVAATNRPDVLDPALLRPGRFDRRIVINRPDIKGREGILIVHTQTIPTDEDVNLNIIAKGTSGFSGADLENLVNEAALNAARYNQSTVSMKDFEFAKDKVMMGSERRSLVISDEQKKITAIHEAGHAFMATRISNADPVHKVTIIPRGMSLGSTSMLPEEDQHGYSKAQLKSKIAVLLGGRCAEEVFNGHENITSGASNDIERATEIAQKMVCEWGMSDKIGPVQHTSGGENPFLGKQFSEAGPSCSEETSRVIDSEIKAIITTQYETTLDMIQSEKQLLQKFAEELIVKETMSGDEVQELLNNH